MTTETDWHKLVEEQRNALLDSPRSAVCTHQYRSVAAAARKATDINNGWDSDWSPNHFAATHTRGRNGAGYYEVFVRIRPGLSLTYLCSFYRWQHGNPKYPDMPADLAVFWVDLGSDNIATRAVNTLYRLTGISSLAELRELRKSLGEVRFEAEIRQMRHIGGATAARIMEKSNG